MIVSWFSAGVSSAVATKMAIQRFGEVKVIYTHIEDQHEDTMRFIKDCEEWFGIEIEIQQSPLISVENACLQSAYMVSPNGAACTRLLKRRVRKEWELNNLGNEYIWGFDFEERERAGRMSESTPDNVHHFPLIDAGITKKRAHGILRKQGVKRPAMYDMGYPNNNCVGCLRGGMGYWNKIREDFTEVFESRCQLEEKLALIMQGKVGARIFKDFKLRDLTIGRGRDQKVIVPDCGLFCDIDYSSQ